MASSIKRGARALPRLAALAPLLLGACQAPSPALQEWEIPSGRTLARDGLAPGGGLLAALDDAAAAARCRAPQVWARAGGGWREVARGPALPGDPCPRVTARLAPDGRTLAVYDYGAGRAEMLDVDVADGRRIVAAGTATLAARSGSRFPPPGPNLAFSGDGRKLLLGSTNHGCRALAGGGRACGLAQLFERRDDGWERGAALLPGPELDGPIRFGQAVALDAAGRLALVGGTGQPGRSGALGVFAVENDGPRLVQILAPPSPQGGFANDLALSSDGRWLAVGGEQSVHLYERAGEGFALRKSLLPPDRAAGYFGETVALSGDGRRLLVGAPRTDCAAGARCGLVYLFEHDHRLWRLTRAIRPAAERPEANFGHRLALSADGGHAAAQGAALHVFALGPALAH